MLQLIDQDQESEEQKPVCSYLLEQVADIWQKEAHASSAGIDQEKLQKAGQLFSRLVIVDPIRGKYWESRAVECNSK